MSSSQFLEIDLTDKSSVNQLYVLDGPAAMNVPVVIVAPPCEGCGHPAAPPYNTSSGRLIHWLRDNRNVEDVFEDEPSFLLNLHEYLGEVECDECFWENDEGVI